MQSNQDWTISRAAFFSLKRWSLHFVCIREYLTWRASPHYIPPEVGWIHVLLLDKVVPFFNIPAYRRVIIALVIQRTYTKPGRLLCFGCTSGSTSLSRARWTLFVPEHKSKTRNFQPMYWGGNRRILFFWDQVQQPVLHTHSHNTESDLDSIGIHEIQEASSGG